MFWFKKKEIVVDCFTVNPTIYTCNPIAPANNFFPAEWKSHPKFIRTKYHSDNTSNLEVDLPTIKKCIGFINLYNVGFMIPSWCDFGIEIREDGSYTYHNAGDLRIDQHPRFQVWDTLYKDYGHAKIGSPWLLKEKTGVQFSWHQCDWHKTDVIDKFKIVSGVVDFKYQHQTNVNMFIKKGSSVNFNAGEPLAHLIPISDSNVKIKNHLIDGIEMSKIDFRPTQYSNQYRKMKNVIENKSKCPFGFGK